jgi:predicted  nucleic acid-binding Zn-ribbon protein
MSGPDIQTILDEIKKTNNHINDIYKRIDGIKDNQFSMQKSILELSNRLSDNQSQDFKNNIEIQKQIKAAAKKHGSTSGKKWAGIGSGIAALITIAFKLYEKFSG